MNMLLLGITTLSLLIAGVSAGVAWRVVRADRRRTAARVAALAAAAGVRPASGGAATQLRPVDTSVEPRDISAVQEFLPAATTGASPRITEPLSSPPSDADTVLVTGGAIFARPAVDSGSSGRQLRLLTAAAVVGLLAVGGAGAMFVSGRAPTASRQAPRSPLELVALMHSRTDGVLSVSGVVRNPAGGTPVDHVDAQVRVFDAAGIMIATRSARLELPRLAPGQDAPFAVALGEATTAARYRVSFAADGNMLPHVDRRTNLPAAVTADAR
jgi:hypothetical protein